MPPVVAAAAAGAAAAAASAAAAGTLLTAATLTAMATSAAISAALAGATMLLSPKQKPFRQEAQDRTANVRQPITPRQIIYGEVRTGGPIVFMHVRSNSRWKNRWLHMIIPLAAHEVEHIGDVMFDDDVLPLNELGEVTGGRFFDAQHETPQFRSRATVVKHRGEPGQVASSLMIEHTGGKWTSAHVGHGIAYLYVALEHDIKIYAGGIPKITAIVKGKKLFDPRTGVTAYSTNAALCIRDFLTLPVIEGGVGATADELDAVNWNAAANLCDEIVPAGESTEPRYTINGTVVLSSSNTPKNTLEAMLTATGGTLVYAGGRWRLTGGAYRTPTVTLTDADLRGRVRTQTRVSRREQFTAVKGTYVSPLNKWQPADYPPVISDTAAAEDGGEVRFREIDRPFTTSSAAAQRLGKMDLLKTRQQLTVTVECKLTAFRVQAGDIVLFTRPRLGWNAKPFEVTDWSFAVAQDGALGIDLVLRETHASVFDWATSEEQTVDPAPNSDLPNWRVVPVPEDVDIESGASLVIEGADGSLISRALVTWTEPDDYSVSRYQIQYRISGAAGWPYEAETIGLEYSIDRLPVGTSIDVRVRALNSLGVASDWVTIFNHTITGTSARPNPTITGLKVQGSPEGQPGYWNTNSVTFVWDEAASLGLLLDGYLVTISEAGGGPVRRTAVVTAPSFHYSFADNATDGLVRSFDIAVQARTRLGGLSEPAVLTATNPPPGVPGGVEVVGEFRLVSLRYTPPPDPDWSGILVWVSETAGQTTTDPAAARYDGPDTFVVLNAAPGKTFYVRFACYDVFGKTGLTLSAEQAVSTVHIVHADLAQGVIDSSNLIPELNTQIAAVTEYGTRIDEVETLTETTAGQLTTLQSTVGGHSSSLSIQASAVAGLQSQYTVKVQTDGYVSGFGLASTAVNGTPTSSFVVSADRFAIAKPGAGGIAPTIPFIVQTVGSTPVLSFQGYARFDRILTGTLDTETLYIGGTNVVLDGPTRQIRVNNGTTDLVKLGRLTASPATYGIEIRDTSGNLILSSAGGLANIPAGNITGLGSLATVNQITAANASTYIASAAITSAHIATLGADKITAGDVNALGINIRAGALDVYDGIGSSSLRIRIGHWPGRCYGIVVRDPANGAVLAEFSTLQNYLNAALIGDATITNAKIAHLTLGGEKIQDFAASNSGGAVVAGNAAVTITTTGKPCSVIGTMQMLAAGGATNTWSSACILRVDGSTQLDSSYITGVDAGQAVHRHVCAGYYAPGAGSHRFEIVASQGVSQRASIIVIEHRK